MIIAAVLTITEVGPGPVSLDAALGHRAQRRRLGAGRAGRRRGRLGLLLRDWERPAPAPEGGGEGLAPLEGQPHAEADQHGAGEALRPREPRALDERAPRAGDEVGQRRVPDEVEADDIAAISSADGSTGAPAGTNCGKRATKKTASLGLARLVTRPSRSGAPRAGAGPASAGLAMAAQRLQPSRRGRPRRRA